jgi:superfamily II DNA or RNA helicase
MTGYFTSSALSELSYSLSYFLSTKGSGLKFIVSPNLDKKDMDAIRNAVTADANLIPLIFPEFELSQDSLKTKALEALGYLVATKMLEIRIALQDEGLFHTKCWLFDTEKGKLAVHGSGNATQSGLSINFEQLTVSRSWLSNEAESIVLKLEDRFSKIWDGHYQGLSTFTLNKQTMEYLSNIYQDVKGNSQSDIADKLREYIEKDNVQVRDVQELQVPDWLNYTTGDFAHQGEAVKAWRDNNGRGVLSIATGGGKTLTSLVAATLIASSEEKFLLVVAVPTVALLDQWAEDVSKFGVKPINAIGLSTTKIAQEINNSIRKMKIKASKAEVIVITHEALKNEKLNKLFKKASKSTTLMLIGDEVHNLGSIGFQQTAIDEFVYRLGLSATVERQYDDIGTDFLLDYFGPVVYDYPLNEAIGVCLVPYNYYVHKVELDKEEAEKWSDLTYDIKKLSYAAELSDGAPEKERWKLLCLKRRRIVESAKGKVSVLSHSLPESRENISRTLIFCTDKYPEQILEVNQLLIRKGVRFHQVTADETSNKARLKKIIELFSSDEYQVLTSKRVLDEGFNIPQTETAYILASNTVTRQWVQRLGRVLRKSTDTNKTSAEIHDFVVVPPVNGAAIDLDMNALLAGELSRVQYFDALSMNGLEAGGTSNVIEELLELLGAL